MTPAPLISDALTTPSREALASVHGSQAVGMGGHHSASAGKDEWLTPPEIFTALGPFDLDPCSPINRPWPTAANHFTIIDNGLRKEWTGRVWCNPPYGRETGKWLARCADHGNATALIFARTETQDWVEHVWKRAHSILFLWGRIYFYHVDGTRASANSGAPSALIAYDEANTIALENSNLAGRVIRLANTELQNPKTKMQLQPHQERVVDEKSELDTKIMALEKFIAGSPIFAELPEDERERLVRQASCMTEYSGILAERIAAF